MCVVCMAVITEGLAQMVEHLLRMQEVLVSIPRFSMTLTLFTRITQAQKIMSIYNNNSII